MNLVVQEPTAGVKTDPPGVSSLGKGMLEMRGAPARRQRVLLMKIRSDPHSGFLGLLGSFFARPPITATVQDRIPYLEIDPLDGTGVRTVQLSRDSLSIGRDSSNGLQLEGTAVGSFQCELLSTKIAGAGESSRRWYLRRSPRDSKNTNPTRLRRGESDVPENTRTIAPEQSVELEDGDTIYFFAEPDETRWVLHFRNPNATVPVEGFPRLQIDRATSTVWLRDGRNRRHLNLTKQLRTLLFAMDELNHANNNEPTVCSYDYIVQKIWESDSDPSFEANVRSLIRVVRDEIDRVCGIDGEGERFIETVPGEGYRLVTEPGPRAPVDPNGKKSRTEGAVDESGPPSRRTSAGQKTRSRPSIHQTDPTHSGDR